MEGEPRQRGRFQCINIQPAYKAPTTGTMMPIAIAATRKTRSPIAEHCKRPPELQGAERSAAGFNSAAAAWISTRGPASNA